MTERDCLIKGNWTKIKYYPVSVEKLKQATMREAAYFIAPVNIGEDYEYFDEVKKFLIIPEPRKSIEELSQELDEKFDDLLVKTKRKFAVSQQNAEYYYNQKFKKINDNFEHIKEWGSPPRITLIPGGETLLNGGNYLVAHSGSSPIWSMEFKIGNGDVGYYTNGTELRVYMPKKPNMIVRFCMDKLLGFKWVNKK